MPGLRVGDSQGAGPGSSCPWHLTWLISPEENWMALLPTGLGRGGKRIRQALGSRQVSGWVMGGWPRLGGGEGAGVTSFCSAGRWQPWWGALARCPGTSGRISTLLPVDLGTGTAGWCHSVPSTPRGTGKPFWSKGDHPMKSTLWRPVRGGGLQPLPSALVWMRRQGLQVSPLSAVTS